MNFYFVFWFFKMQMQATNNAENKIEDENTIPEHAEFISDFIFKRQYFYF